MNVGRCRFVPSGRKPLENPKGCNSHSANQECAGNTGCIFRCSRGRECSGPGGRQQGVSGRGCLASTLLACWNRVWNCSLLSHPEPLTPRAAGGEGIRGAQRWSATLHSSSVAPSGSHSLAEFGVTVPLVGKKVRDRDCSGKDWGG